MGLGRNHAQATTGEELTTHVRATFDWLQKPAAVSSYPLDRLLHGARVAYLSALSAITVPLANHTKA